MTIQKTNTDQLVVELGTDCPQLRKAIFSLDSRQFDWVQSAAGASVLVDEDKLWKLALELSTKFNRRFWESIRVEVFQPNADCDSRFPCSLMDLYHHHVAPWLVEQIEGGKASCFHQAVVSSSDLTQTVGNEFFLQTGVDDKPVSHRELFEFADRVGLTETLNENTIKFCLPHCMSMCNEQKAFLNVDPACCIGMDSTWTQLLDDIAENVNDPSSIVLEISMIGDGDINLLVGFAEQVRERGLSIALDNWGQANNSIRTLNLIRPEYVKVSGELTCGAYGDPYRQKLLSGITNLATDLGILTVAEGISEIADCSHSIEVGFDWLQGAFFGSPVQADSAGEPKARGSVATTSSLNTH